MQNEQCGKCWNLKFDRQGDKTHKDLNKNSHDFVPLDYCVKCLEPKYSQFGHQTHPDETYDFMQTQNAGMSHEFISGIETKFQEHKRNQKYVLRFFGIGLIGIVSIAGLSSLFF